MTRGPSTRRLVRRVAALAVAVAFAAAVTGCTDNANNAAKITYTLPGGSSTTTVSQSELLDIVEHSLDSSAFRQTLVQQGYLRTADKSDSTTDATLTAFWLNFLINQAVAKSVLDNLHRKVTDADRQAAAQNAATVPKSLQKTLTDALAEIDAARKVCPSQRFLSAIVFQQQGQADAAYRQLKGGADFESTANKAKQGTGHIGCVGPYLPKEVLDVATRAPVNLITVPVKFQNGYAILRITPWSDQDANDQQSSQPVSAAFDSLVDSARVTVNPRFGSWTAVSRQDQQTGQVQIVHEVVPPAVPTPRNNRTITTTTTAPRASLVPQG
jgi:hypothetical protein